MPVPSGGTSARLGHYCRKRASPYARYVGNDTTSSLDLLVNMAECFPPPIMGLGGSVTVNMPHGRNKRQGEERYPAGPKRFGSRKSARATGFKPWWEKKSRKVGDKPLELRKSPSSGYGEFPPAPGAVRRRGMAGNGRPIRVIGLVCGGNGGQKFIG